MINMNNSSLVYYICLELLKIYQMKIGIIICSRYKDCAGGKCFRSMQNREGAFSVYSKDTPLEVVGYVGCGGCPGVNVEYAPAEMIKNGVEVIHLATGMVVGYPPCPRVDFFKKFIEEKYKIPVIIGTHPIPEKYLVTHKALKTWNSKKWQDLIHPVMSDPLTMKVYD